MFAQSRPFFQGRPLFFQGGPVLALNCVGNILKSLPLLGPLFHGSVLQSSAVGKVGNILKSLPLLKPRLLLWWLQWFGPWCIGPLAWTCRWNMFLVCSVRIHWPKLVLRKSNLTSMYMHVLIKKNCCWSWESHDWREKSSFSTLKALKFNCWTKGN